MFLFLIILCLYFAILFFPQNFKFTSHNSVFLRILSLNLQLCFCFPEFLGYISFLFLFFPLRILFTSHNSVFFFFLRRVYLLYSFFLLLRILSVHRAILFHSHYETKHKKGYCNFFLTLKSFPQNN